MLTPLDIHNQEFRRVRFGGYSEDEVDDFLDRVVVDFEALLKEVEQQRTELDDLRGRLEQYKQLEATLHRALIVAQETSEEVKQNARKEAQLIVREAEEEATRRIKQAEGRIRELEERAAQVQREAQAFRSQWRSQLEGHLEMLRDGVPPQGRREQHPTLPSTGNPGDTHIVTHSGTA